MTMLKMLTLSTIGTVGFFTATAFLSGITLVAFIMLAGALLIIRTVSI